MTIINDADGRDPVRAWGGRRTVGPVLLQQAHHASADTSQHFVFAGAPPPAATPIDTAQSFYLQSHVGTSVLPDFQGGTLRIDQQGATDNSNYAVENFFGNTIDAFGHSIVFGGDFSIHFGKADFASFSDVQAHMTQSGADVIITLDAQDFLTLHNVLMSNLHASDFLFG